MSSATPKPFPVVYNADLGAIQYVFGTGQITIPEASVNAITALTGDVTASGPGSVAATVASVGGSTAASVHTSQLLTAAATASATASTLVLRDGAGGTNLHNLNVTASSGPAEIDLRSTDATSLSALICHNDGDSAQAYFGIGNSAYGDPLIRNCPSVISAALAHPFVIETQGFIPPLYTTTNRDAIPTPHEGLTLYNTTTHESEVYNGTSWGPMVVPAGDNTGSPTFPGGLELQYNNAGVYGADGFLSYKPSTKTLVIGDDTNAPEVLISGSTAEVYLTFDGTDLIDLSVGAGGERIEVRGANGQMVMGAVSPDASAVLDLTSTIRGFLPPRMTTTQRDAITSPAEGLTVYNLTTHTLNFWNGSAWTAV